MRSIALASLILLGASSGARAEVQKAKILETVRAAFDSYEQIPCVGLKFEYMGDPPGLPKEELGAIVVYFADDTLWTAGNTAYLAHAETGNAENLISKAWVGFNAAKWWWTITDPVEPDKIDMQTALMKLLPGALGYYVGSAPQSGSVDIDLGVLDRTLDDLRELGAKAIYFDDEANGCSEERPADPIDCDAIPTPDAGVADAGGADAGAGDAGPAELDPLVCLFRQPKGGRSFHWEGDTIKYYVYVPEDGKLPGGSGGGSNGGGVADGGVGGDAGASGCTSHDQCGESQICSSRGICVAQSGGDGGCCRIGHTREENLTYGVLLALVMVFGLRRRRRPR